MKKLTGAFFCLILTASAYAQDINKKNEMATGLRANGKIYVVMAVVVTILIGLIAYLIRLDRKISKLEKNNLNDRL